MGYIIRRQKDAILCYFSKNCMLLFNIIIICSFFLQGLEYIEFGKSQFYVSSVIFSSFVLIKCVVRTKYAYNKLISIINYIGKNTSAYIYTVHVSCILVVERLFSHFGINNNASVIFIIILSIVEGYLINNYMVFFQKLRGRVWQR